MTTHHRRTRRSPAAPKARLYAALQAARHARGLDEETYYAALADVVGRPVSSTTDLSVPEAARCLDRLNGAQRHDPERWDGARKPLLAHIRRSLLPRIAGADGRAVTEAYAEAVLCRQRGLPKGTACPLATATPQELRGVIAALHKRLGAGVAPA